jgi:hypothetical protein
MVSPFREDLSRGPKNGSGLGLGTDNRQFVYRAVLEAGFVVEARNSSEFAASSHFAGPSFTVRAQGLQGWQSRTERWPLLIDRRYAAVIQPSLLCLLFASQR